LITLGCFLGSYAGAVLGIPLSGILTEYLNWQVAFYFYGKIYYKFD
jgi:ACS family sodium-dependent inorganic phosphate cotransporter-like MFS transporter 6/7/8